MTKYASVTTTGAILSFFLNEPVHIIPNLDTRDREEVMDDIRRAQRKLAEIEREHGLEIARIKEVNRQLGPGYRGNLHLARDRADIDGGFILRRGKVQINVSVEVLIQRAHEELEMELTSELFGEQA